MQEPTGGRREQFQQNCEAVSLELRKNKRLEHFAARWKHLASHKCGQNKEIERFCDSRKSRNAQARAKARAAGP
jgi:hypothetical protein